MDTQTEIPTRMSTRVASGSRVPEHFQGGRRKSDCASMTSQILASYSSRSSSRVTGNYSQLAQSRQSNKPTGGHRLAINLYSSVLGEEQCTLARIDGAGVGWLGVIRGPRVRGRFGVVIVVGIRSSDGYGSLRGVT